MTARRWRCTILCRWPCTDRSRSGRPRSSCSRLRYSSRPRSGRSARCRGWNRRGLRSMSWWPCWQPCWQPSWRRASRRRSPRRFHPRRLARRRRSRASRLPRFPRTRSEQTRTGPCCTQSRRQQLRATIRERFESACSSWPCAERTTPSRARMVCLGSRLHEATRPRGLEVGCQGYGSAIFSAARGQAVRDSAMCCCLPLDSNESRDWPDRLRHGRCAWDVMGLR